MQKPILVTFLTLLNLHFATTFHIQQENFTIRSLNESWVRVEQSDFTNNTFTIRVRILKDLPEFHAMVKGYQMIGRQLKPSPFNWDIDMCKLVLNPLKYNLVVGSFFISMNRGNSLGQSCPVPADYLYFIENYELKADFLPRFFPPGHFIFMVTTNFRKYKLMQLEWIWDITHHTDVSGRDRKGKRTRFDVK